MAPTTDQQTQEGYRFYSEENMAERPLLLKTSDQIDKLDNKIFELIHAIEAATIRITGPKAEPTKPITEVQVPPFLVGRMEYMLNIKNKQISCLETVVKNLTEII